MKRQLRSITCSLVIVCLACSGCQALKRVIIRPPREGVSQESAAVRAHIYKSEVIVKATPKEVMDYFVKDISWLNKVGGILKKYGIEAEMPEVAPGQDMTQVGRSTKFTVKIMGIKLPCQVVTCRYVPEKELWLLFHSDTVWMLGRIYLSPHPKGTTVAFNFLIVPSKTLGTLIDTFKLTESIAGLIDLVYGITQAEFDPDLDLKELTQHGLRGELSEGLLQSYQGQTLVNARLEKVQNWINEPENFLELLKEFNIEKDRAIEFLQVPPDTFFYSPGAFEWGLFKLKIDMFAIQIPRDQGYAWRVYLRGLNLFGYFEFELSPEMTGGTLATSRFVSEIPASTSSEGMDFILFEAGIPEIIQEKILAIKNEFE